MNTLRVVILGAALVISFGACSSAGKCKRGELGCACLTGNTCEPGAHCVAARCKKSAAATGGVGGRSGTGGGTGGRDANTGGTDAPPRCSAVSFDAACRSYCTAFCESQEAFCKRSACMPGYCESPSYTSEVLPACKKICGDDADCTRDMCLDLRRATCETFGFEADGGVMPACFENDPKCELRSN
jgi:hypothetical protein